MPTGDDYDAQADPLRARRATFLTILLTLLAGCGFLLFLVLITGGLLLYVVLGLAGIAALGLFHYMLWGHAFSQDVAGEREEAELRARIEEEERLAAEDRRLRRL